MWNKRGNVTELVSIQLPCLKLSEPLAEPRAVPWLNRGSKLRIERHTEMKTTESNTAAVATPKQVKPAKAKPAAKQATARTKGESITVEIPGIGTVTLAPDQIALAGTAWQSYAKLCKEWEKNLKEGNDRIKGLKLPKAATFSEAVRFLGDELKGTMFPVQAVAAHKGNKPKKGKATGSWRITRAALIMWRRENGPFFKREIDPVHGRILAIMRKTVETFVTGERVLTGDVKVRTYRNTVGVSANKKDKAAIAG